MLKLSNDPIKCSALFVRAGISYFVEVNMITCAMEKVYSLIWPVSTKSCAEIGFNKNLLYIFGYCCWKHIAQFNANQHDIKP